MCFSVKGTGRLYCIKKKMNGPCIVRFWTTTSFPQPEHWRWVRVGSSNMSMIRNILPRRSRSGCVRSISRFWSGLYYLSQRSRFFPPCQMFTRRSNCKQAQRRRIFKSRHIKNIPAIWIWWRMRNENHLTLILKLTLQTIVVHVPANNESAKETGCDILYTRNKILPVTNHGPRC